MRTPTREQQRIFSEPTAHIQQSLSSDIAQNLVGNVQRIERPAHWALVTFGYLDQIEIRRDEGLRIQELSL
jgi:hypothetical protein